MTSPWQSQARARHLWIFVVRLRRGAGVLLGSMLYFGWNANAETQRMGQPLKQLVSDALELPAHERAQLAHRLIISLDEEIEDDPAEVQRAWEDETRRRMAEVDAVTAELIPAEQVFSELR